MGVRITDTDNVALYDSTGGVAFGPIFDSSDEAESFLTWLDRSGYGDARTIPLDDLFTEHAAWSEWNIARREREQAEDRIDYQAKLSDAAIDVLSANGAQE